MILQTVEQIQQKPLLQIKNIKTIMINEMNNMLLAKTTVVQYKSHWNLYPIFFRRRRRPVSPMA